MNKYLENKIKSLSKNKSDEQLRMDLYSTMIPVLLSTDLFKKNYEIRELTDKLILKKEMKDYLFASRTQIVARMVREIDKFERDQMEKNVLIFQEFIFNNQEVLFSQNKVKYQKNISKKNQEDKILKMMDKYSRNKDIHDE